LQGVRSAVAEIGRVESGPGLFISDAMDAGQYTSEYRRMTFEWR
jgi:hypothetical protein